MRIQKTRDGEQSGNSADRAAKSENNREVGENGLRDSASPQPGAKQWQAGKAAGSAEFVQATEENLEKLKKMFGKNLARIRKEVGYSQLDLSLEISRSHNFINDLEHGVKGASFQTLSRLSAILRTPVYVFFEPVKKQPPVEGFRYPEPVGQMLNQLRETIDTWSENWIKQEENKTR
jgi:transcriptional regulator with XRE-family HTH domain